MLHSGQACVLHGMTALSTRLRVLGSEYQQSTSLSIEIMIGWRQSSVRALGW